MAGRAEAAGTDAAEDVFRDSMITPGGATSDPPRAWPLSSELPPLAPVVSVPHDARKYTVREVMDWGLGDLADTAALVVSELMTNAVRASAKDASLRCLDGSRMPLVQLRLFSDGLRLLIEVHDRAQGSPVLREAGLDSENGRGLHMVHGLTNGHWGYGPVDGGKCVWAALGAL